MQSISIWCYIWLTQQSYVSSWIFSTILKAESRQCRSGWVQSFTSISFQMSSFPSLLEYALYLVWKQIDRLVHCHSIRFRLQLVLHLVNLMTTLLDYMHRFHSSHQKMTWSIKQLSLENLVKREEANELSEVSVFGLNEDIRVSKDGTKGIVWIQVGFKEMYKM